MQFQFKDDLDVDFKLKECGIVWLADPNTTLEEATSKLGLLVGV
jgi:hypothetical protein